MFSRSLWCLALQDYESEKWFDLYRVAMLELQRAAMTGRIGDARTEIAYRLEVLKEFPLLHSEERQAIQDALGNLRVLEKEEARLAEEDRKRLLREAAQKLQRIAPKFQESTQP